MKFKRDREWCIPSLKYTVAHKYHGKSLKQATYLQLFHDNINLKTGTQFYKPQQTLKKDCSKSFQSTATKVSSSGQKFQVHGKSFKYTAKVSSLRQKFHGGSKTTGSNEREVLAQLTAGSSLARHR